MVVAGSVARGLADERSDIELPIFWQSAPTDELRHSLIDALQGQLLFEYDGPSGEDQLLVNGVQVDLWHVTVEHQEDVIESVVARNRTDLESLNAMDTVRSCIPLYGHELVEHWKQRAVQYPRSLASAIIGQHLESFRLDRLALCHERNDPTGFYSELAVLQQDAFLVLLALNEQYFPTFKWLYATLDHMDIKPERIVERFRRAFTTSRSEAIADMQSALFEVIGLVERRFPEIETSLTRRRLAYRRSAVKPGAGEALAALADE